MPRIVLRKKAEIIAEYRFNRKKVITIGSIKGNTIMLADKGVSERHCSITPRDTGYEVKDNNTVSGTRVNERPVTVKDIQFEDVVGVGSYSLVLLPDQRKKDKGDATTGAGELRKPRRYLVGIYGMLDGKKYELKEGESFVGRENVSPRGIPNDIVLLGDMTVSKGHAKIACSEGQCVLTDIGSTGGVAVNGAKVGQLNDITLHAGDEVAIGHTIFRLVEEGAENLSLPRKHSIFLLKIRQPVIAAVMLLLLAGSFAAIYRGATGVSTIRSAPKKVNIDINRFWAPQDNLVRLALPEYDMASSPALGDINRDGVNDIVYLNSSGALFAWDGKKGGQLWKPVEIYNSGKTSPVIADMNGDGTVDVVVLSDNSMLYIIDGNTGGVIRKEILGGTIAELSPAVHDINGDGELDVVACSEEGMTHFVYSPGFETKMEKYAEYVEGPVYASPVIVTTEKIAPLVIVGSYHSRLSIFDGKTRNKRSVDLAEKTGKVHLIAAVPGVGDLNGDGTPEIVVQSNVPQYISAVDMNNFNVLWTYFVEPIPPSGLGHTSPPVITDLNRDGTADVIVLSANGFIYGLKGNTGFPAGELLWKTSIAEYGGRIVGSPALYDFEKDGTPDIVFGTENGSVMVVKSDPFRKEMDVVAAAKASNAPITSSPVLGDINGDGQMEIVVSSLNDAVLVLTTNVRTFKNRIPWPMYLGSALHSAGGLAAGREDERPFLAMTASGMVTIILLLMVTAIAKSKKLRKRPKVVYV